MDAALRATLSVAVVTEVLEDARLAERVQAFVYRVGISVEPCAEWALKKNMEIAFFDIFD